MRAFVVAAALAMVAFAAPSSASSCGFLPKRPPRIISLPPDPSQADPCTGVVCPRSNNPCLEDSVCVDGQCLDFAVKPFGTPCNDGDSNTIDDVCSAGVCRGLSIQCPDDVEDRPAGSRPETDEVAVSWESPQVSMHPGHAVSVSPSIAPGSNFPVGVTTVTYTATTSSGAEASCSFEVKVFAEEDPCASVECEEQNVCQTQLSVCRVEGIRGVCSPGGPIPDGFFDKGGLYQWHGWREPAAERFAESFRQFNFVKCIGGSSVCEGNKRLQLVRPPRPPPVTPGQFGQPQLPFTTTKALPITTRPATYQPSTTRTTKAPTTTTARRPRGMDTCHNGQADKGGNCWCSSDCLSCEWDHDTLRPGSCEICTNDQYLYNSRCVNRCPAGYTEVGTGKQFRQCVENRRRSLLSLDTQSAVVELAKLPVLRRREAKEDMSVASENKGGLSTLLVSGLFVVGAVVSVGMFAVAVNLLLSRKDEGDLRMDQLESQCNQVSETDDFDVFESADSLRRTKSMPELVVDDMQ